MTYYSQVWYCIPQYYSLYRFLSAVHAWHPQCPSSVCQASRDRLVSFGWDHHRSGVLWSGWFAWGTKRIYCIGRYGESIGALDAASHHTRRVYIVEMEKTWLYCDAGSSSHSEVYYVIRRHNIHHVIESHLNNSMLSRWKENQSQLRYFNLIHPL